MSAWPEDRDVYANVIQFLDQSKIEICSPSEVRFEYFQKRKELSEISPKFSLPLDQHESFGSVSFRDIKNNPPCSSEKAISLEKGTAENGGLGSIQASKLLSRRHGSFRFLKNNSENTFSSSSKLKNGNSPTKNATFEESPLRKSLPSGNQC